MICHELFWWTVHEHSSWTDLMNHWWMFMNVHEHSSTFITWWTSSHRGCATVVVTCAQGNHNHDIYLVNMICWSNAGIMLCHRRRRWPNIIPALVHLIYRIIDPVDRKWPDVTNTMLLNDVTWQTSDVSPMLGQWLKLTTGAGQRLVFSGNQSSPIVRNGWVIILTPSFNFVFIVILPVLWWHFLAVSINSFQTKT